MLLMVMQRGQKHTTIILLNPKNKSSCRRKPCFSGKIQTRLVEALQTRDRGVKHGDLHVIRENDMPAVLTELAFIDNGIDYSKLSTANGRQIAAEAIYEGVLDYYEWKGNNVSEYRL